MLKIINKFGEGIGCLLNNAIINADDDLVNGIILGDCVFGKDGAIVGKFFHNIFYTLSGEIAARVQSANNNTLDFLNLSKLK